jgi:hypothetical protein
MVLHDVDEPDGRTQEDLRAFLTGTVRPSAVGSRDRTGGAAARLSDGLVPDTGGTHLAVGGACRPRAGAGDRRHTSTVPVGAVISPLLSRARGAGERVAGPDPLAISSHLAEVAA